MSTEEKLKIAIASLEAIKNPIKYIKSNLKDGEQLNGVMTIQLLEKPEFYKNIATEALKQINP